MALDEDVAGAPGEAHYRLAPGPLLSLCSPEELREEPLKAARLGFRRRLIETPGVVASNGQGESVGCPIVISAIRYPVRPETNLAFERLRSAWVSPADDYELLSGAEVWSHAKALSLGLVYRWNPRPPREWLEPRRQWGALVRKVISNSRTLDSELHVAQVVDAGRLEDDGALARWRAVRDTFIPNPVPVWFDDSALLICAEWMRRPGLVWTEHTFFAERLSKITGAPYYGAQGLDASGRFIDDAPPGAVIASIDANREGRNLQTKWSRCLYTSAPEGAGVWQQSLGRFHRPGQRADEVVVDVLLGCIEHANAWRKARAAAEAIRDTTGAESKLLLADVIWPTDEQISRYTGARWGVNERGE